jgi:hypothetical protein
MYTCNPNQYIVSPPMPSAAPTPPPCFAQPPVVYQQPSRRSITSSPSLVTSTTHTRWSPIELPRSPSLWTVCTSPLLLPHQSPIPSSIHSVLADPHWHRAMEEEYTTLLSNSTWDLVPRPSDANVVTGKWIFKHKLKADGSLDRYKTRWVLRGFTQCLMSTMIRLSTQW